jgi:hypothetical protein
MSARLSLVTLILLSLACTRQTVPGVYRFISTGPTRLLVPPGISDPARNRATFDFPLAKPVSPECRTRDEVFRVDPHRAFLRIGIQRDALLARPPRWLGDWTAALEQQGCIDPGKSRLLAERIVESVPMDPAVAYRLLHPAAADFTDLVPGFRLKLVSPILRDGAPAGASAITTDTVSGSDAKLSLTLRTSSDFLGYEISWYGVEADGRLAFATAESHIGNQVTASVAPRVNYFAFPETASCYRLFYLTRVSQADHNAVVLSASTRAELDRQTPSFVRDPDACTKAARACVALSNEVGLTIYFTVNLNGAPHNVPADSTIADALRSAGVRDPASVLPSLTVRRNYKGAAIPVEFDRTRPDILTLKLMGREDIRW